MHILEEKLTKGMNELGLAIDEKALTAFRKYYELLEETNKVMNLTAISGESDVASLHFLDSLALLKVTEFENKRVIDIGSGAGFPGIPLKIGCPSMKLTMLDALAKRVGFMARVCEEAGIEAEPIHGRAEEYGQKKEYREQFDFAVSRAVASMNMLAELCIPFIKVGGCMLAMKSVDSGDEVKKSEECLEKLGCVVERTVDYAVPHTDVTHRCVVIRKVSPTPKQYPRRFAKIQKEPL
ncbi:MAG: 16S rRNA (guanine(527)-N(7))-methyltransferase RsmG [Ruminococcaceae bacterium]|nr:16S rRNA (guanine(527)-N(7))-methyltransferase RsmG [Oscillospiraceae bacterium]